MNLIVKPGGVLVLYAPDATDDDAERVAKRFGVASIEKQFCEVDVPFLPREWQKIGLGLHEVAVFALKLLDDSSSDGKR